MGTLPLWVGKMLNPRVEISRLGLGGLQEVVFHGFLRGGKGCWSGRHA